MKSSRSDKTPRRSTRSPSVLMSLPSDEVDVVSDSVRVTPSPTTPPPESIGATKSKKRKHTASKSDPQAKVTSPYFDTGKSKTEEEGDDSDAPLITAAKRQKKSQSRTDSKTAAKPKSATARKKNKDSANDSAATQKSKPKPKKATPKQNDSNAANDDDNTPVGGQPDGHGGLNQPAPFNVEYSKSSRATCRTCDEIIKKGDVRVGHTPLFRGKVNDLLQRHVISLLCRLSCTNLF